jgi:hypothetical protein
MSVYLGSPAHQSAGDVAPIDVEHLHIKLHIKDEQIHEN